MLETLQSLASPVGYALRFIHEGLSLVLAPASGPAWALSIVLLTILVRILLFPLFVKQIKSQRRMQELAPKIKELQAKHKGDRETMNTEMMKLYKDNNANPISGCLPLLLQLPVFFALFTVVRQFGPREEGAYGLTAEQLSQGGEAQVFGAPIATRFLSTAEDVALFGGESLLNVRVVAVVMIILMGATTFWTQRQMMARAGATDPQQVMIQKFLLYVLPLSFAVFGVNFPIGVLLYWLTTNIWSMGQQAWVIKRMPPVVTGGTAAKPAAGGGKGGVATKPGKVEAAPAADDVPPAGKPGKRNKAKAAGTPDGTPGPGTTAPGAEAAPTSSGSTAVPPKGPGARPAGPNPPAAVSASAKRRPAGSRKNKNRRGGRR